VTIDKDREGEIRRLYVAEHWKVGTIVEQLGEHHDVVERVLGLRKAAKSKPAVRDAAAVVAAIPVPAPLLTYETFVAETLKQYPRLRSTRLYDMLVERGYEGSVRSVRRYVQHVRPEPKTEVFLRTEPLIAEQAQIDWGYVGKIRIDGCTRQLWVFVLVLAYSRAMWAELVIDLTASSLRRSLVRACLYFCGVTRQWLLGADPPLISASYELPLKPPASRRRRESSWGPAGRADGSRPARSGNARSRPRDR